MTKRKTLKVTEGNLNDLTENDDYEIVKLSQLYLSSPISQVTNLPEEVLQSVQYMTPSIFNLVWDKK